MEKSIWYSIMKIVHILMGGAFNCEMSYQGNHLPLENSRDGHKVFIITSTNIWQKDKVLQINELIDIIYEKIILIRLNFGGFIFRYLNKKIRKVPDLMQTLIKINPDIILHHDIEGYSLLTVANYVHKNKHVKLYVDTHSNFNNSARNFLSRVILHKIIYGYIIHRAYNYIDKILYISHECKLFAINMHHVEQKKLEFFPLGGDVISLSDKETYRLNLFRMLDVDRDTIIFAHSGKMNINKKTLELLDTFVQIKTKYKIHLVVVGEFSESIKEEALEMINHNPNVTFLGWKKSKELKEIIAGSNYYLQPGSQSATMQISICLATPVVIQRNSSHELYEDSGAILIDENNTISSVLKYLSNNPNVHEELSMKSYDFANKFLSYKILARRITK